MNNNISITNYGFTTIKDSKFTFKELNKVKIYSGAGISKYNHITYDCKVLYQPIDKKKLNL